MHVIFRKEAHLKNNTLAEELLCKMHKILSPNTLILATFREIFK